MEPETLQRAKEGEEKARDKVIAYCRAQLIRYLTMKKYCDIRDIEDWTHDICCEVIKSLHTFRGDCQFRTWVFVIARNVVNEKLKQKTRWRRFLEKVFGSRKESEVYHESPEESLSQQQFAERLDHQISQLPEKQRIVLELHCYKGLQHEEIAKRLGIEASTSRGYLGKARKQLSEFLENEE